MMTEFSFSFLVNYPFMVMYKGTLTKYKNHKSHANTALGIALDLTSDVYKLCCLSWIETPIRKFSDVSKSQSQSKLFRLDKQ